MTAGSYVTGKEEGLDRFIDEMGTEVIWLLGIPTFKLLFDKTAFKALGLDSKFDARNLKDKDVFEKIKTFAQNDKVKEDIEKISKNQKLFKNAVTAKFFVSTALTIGSYIGLTKFKQNFTEKKIRKNLIAEYEKSKKEDNSKKELETNTKDLSNTSFKGLGKTIEAFAFNPVKNMWILDGAITGERLKDSRSPQELIGYGIKEAFTLCFMYYAGDKIQTMLEKSANKKYNKSIGLDARVLEGNTLKKSFEDGSIQKSIEEFKAANTSKADLYEFLHKNPDNLVVKTAKESDVLGVCKEPVKKWGVTYKYNKTDKIDVRKYFDYEGVEGIQNKIETLYKQYKEAIAKGETSEKFFDSVKRLKRGSILTNIGVCIAALGILTPGVMLFKRFTANNDTEFHTKKIIREQLINEGIIA
jgi:hypothetical protein